MKEMRNDLIVLGSTASVQALTATLQTSEYFQNIQVILGIVSASVAILYYLGKFTIKLIRWFHKALEDHKISKEEIDELEEIVDTLKHNEEGE